MKYLKSFESIDANLNTPPIDQDVVMDTLSTLKDDGYVEVNFRESLMSNKFVNSVRLRILVYDAKGLPKTVSDLYDILFPIFHQMLNNYYNETGNEIYIALYKSNLQNWYHTESILDCHLLPIENISKHTQNNFNLILTKDSKMPTKMKSM